MRTLLEVDKLTENEDMSPYTIDELNIAWNSLRNKYNYTQEKIRGFYGDSDYLQDLKEGRRLDEELDRMYNWFHRAGFKLNSETQTWSKKTFHDYFKEKCIKYRLYPKLRKGWENE